MIYLCPSCGYREQGLSGFCDRCDAERSTDSYKRTKDELIRDRESAVLAAHRRDRARIQEETA